MTEIKKTSYPYPKTLLDEHGYPTQKALDYIKNWCAQLEPKKDGSEEQELVVGEFHTSSEKLQNLIDYIKELWFYDDAVRQNENYLEIHTLGWSGNEEVIEVLKKSSLWYKLDMTQSGGHYYFKLKSGDFFNRVSDYIFKERLEDFLNYSKKFEKVPLLELVDKYLSPAKHDSAD